MATLISPQRVYRKQETNEIPTHKKPWSARTQSGRRLTSRKNSKIVRSSSKSPTRQKRIAVTVRAESPRRMSGGTTISTKMRKDLRAQSIFLQSERQKLQAKERKFKSTVTNQLTSEKETLRKQRKDLENREHALQQQKRKWDREQRKIQMEKINWDKVIKGNTAQQRIFKELRHLITECVRREDQLRQTKIEIDEAQKRCEIKMRQLKQFEERMIELKNIADIEQQEAKRRIDCANAKESDLIHRETEVTRLRDETQLKVTQMVKQWKQTENRARQLVIQKSNTERMHDEIFQMHKSITEDREELDVLMKRWKDTEKQGLEAHKQMREAQKLRDGTSAMQRAIEARENELNEKWKEIENRTMDFQTTRTQTLKMQEEMDQLKRTLTEERKQLMKDRLQFQDDKDRWEVERLRVFGPDLRSSQENDELKQELAAARAEKEKFTELKNGLDQVRIELIRKAKELKQQRAAFAQQENRADQFINERMLLNKINDKRAALQEDINRFQKEKADLVALRKQFENPKNNDIQESIYENDEILAPGSESDRDMVNDVPDSPSSEHAAERYIPIAHDQNNKPVIIRKELVTPLERCKPTQIKSKQLVFNDTRSVGMKLLTSLGTKGRIIKHEKEEFRIVLLDETWQRSSSSGQLLDAIKEQFMHQEFMKHAHDEAVKMAQHLGGGQPGWFSPPFMDLHICLDNESVEEEGKEISFKIKSISTMRGEPGELRRIMKLPKVVSQGVLNAPTQWFFADIEWDLPSRFPPHVALLCYGVVGVPMRKAIGMDAPSMSDLIVESRKTNLVHVEQLDIETDELMFNPQYSADRLFSAPNEFMDNPVDKNKRSDSIDFSNTNKSIAEQPINPLGLAGEILPESSNYNDKKSDFVKDIPNDIKDLSHVVEDIHDIKEFSKYEQSNSVDINESDHLQVVPDKIDNIDHEFQALVNSEKDKSVDENNTNNDDWRKELLDENPDEKHAENYDLDVSEQANNYKDDSGSSVNVENLNFDNGHNINTELGLDDILANLDSRLELLDTECDQVLEQNNNNNDDMVDIE